MSVRSTFTIVSIILRGHTYSVTSALHAHRCKMWSFSQSTKPPAPSIFSEVDVRQLIQCLPPSPAQLRRSLSGESLIRTAAIRQRFLDILNQEHNFVSIRDLTARLDIVDDDWLLKDESIIVIHSRDGKRLLPNPMQIRIANELEERCKHAYIDIQQEALTRDIALECIRSLIVARCSEQIITLVATGNHQYAVSRSHHDETVQRLRSNMLRTQREASVLDLGSDGLACPRAVLVDNATDWLKHADSGLSGTLTSAKAIIFTPSSAVQSKSKQESQLKADRAVSALKDRGYWLRGTPRVMDRGDAEIAAETIIQQASGDNPEPMVIKCNQDTSVTALIMPTTLNHRLQRLKGVVRDAATQQWSQRSADTDFVPSSRSIVDTVKEQDYAELDMIILQSEEGSGILSDLEQAISDMRSAAEKDFASAMQQDIATTAQLYINGVNTITSDESLRQRTSEHVTQYLKTEVISPVLARIRSEKLTTTRTSHVEVERFSTALNEARDPDQINVAIKRVCRKLKLSSSGTKTPVESKNSAVNPMEDTKGLTPIAVKKYILDRKLGAMQRMKRASDLLQHAIWIMLATLPIEAYSMSLFVTSGKDTSRMIKLCSAVIDDNLSRPGGDVVSDGSDDQTLVGQREDVWTRRRADVTKLLEIKDKLKAGGDDHAMRVELRDMAKSAVEAWERG